MDLKEDRPYSENAPKVWLDWIQKGKRNILKAEKNVEHRNKNDQTPLQGTIENKIIKLVYDYFSKDPCSFEVFATKIFTLMDPNVISINTTRRVKDGGRDAFGEYRIGNDKNGIKVEFSLEAKCHGPNSSVGVKGVSRLISRLRHRQFGVLITTSFVDMQAYKEIKEDKHPIIVISAIDIAKILIFNGYGDTKKLKDWLFNDFQIDTKI